MDYMDYNEMIAKLAERAGLAGSRWAQEILRRLLNQEDAEMLLTLPATLEEFAEKNGLDVATAEAKIKSLDKRGVLFPRRGANGEVVYKNLEVAIGLHDATGFPIMAGTYPATPEQKEIPALWEKWRETEAFALWGGLDTYLRQCDKDGINKFTGMQLRIIPLPGTVEDPSTLLPSEDLLAIIRHAAKTHGIVVNQCICNYPRHQDGRAEGNNEVCYHFSETEVNYLRDRGLARELTVDEALALAWADAEQGLVPLANGGKEEVNQVCMCDNRGCAASRPVAQYGYKLYFPSRYRAVPDRIKCSTCGLCVKRCPYGAIKMEKDMEAYDKGQNIMKVVVDKDVCQGCGVCAVKCPTKAMILKCVRPESFIHSGPSVCALDDPENYFI